jgi:predicted amidohydrolase
VIKKTMRAYCCQLDIAWENKPENYRKVRALLTSANVPPGSLIVLPEMFATGFSMNVSTIVEGESAATAQWAQKLAHELGVYVVAGLAVLDGAGRARNQALVVSPRGEVVARYNKIHPFTLGGEAQHYVAGEELVLCSWGRCRVAPLICYDLRFPEVFRSAVRQGAQLFTVIANWPVKRVNHWVTLLQARAIENQAYVIGVNRAGTDPKHEYSGRSMIIDPHGSILEEIGNREGLISAEIDIDALETWRKDFPALQDMHWECAPPVA